jgi:hypothetical protein
LPHNVVSGILGITGLSYVFTPMEVIFSSFFKLFFELQDAVTLKYDKSEQIKAALKYNID